MTVIWYCNTNYTCIS